MKSKFCVSIKNDLIKERLSMLFGHNLLDMQSYNNTIISRNKNHLNGSESNKEKLGLILKSMHYKWYG